MTPEPFTITTSPDDGLQPWGTVEQSPTGEWWVTTVNAGNGSTTGPYLDQVQAMRALQAWSGS